MYPTHQCAISDDWTYRGMRVIWIENDLLRIGVLAGRGGDIFEFRCKPANVDLMARLPQGIRNPRVDFAQMRDTANQFEDYYYGGWQEIMPNSPTFVYRGASLGQHGEVSLIPWQHALLETGSRRVSVRLWVRPLRVPVLLEKTLTLEADSPTLRVDERLTNEARTPLDVMWGHHIAFGLPFLRDGAKIETSARRFIADRDIPSPRRFRPDVQTDWPRAINLDGTEDDASTIPPEEAAPYNELGYLWDFDGPAWYAVHDTGGRLSFELSWDGDLFKHLWFWQERYASQDAPWWGRAYVIALEPWTTRYSPDGPASIARGEWLHLNAGQVVTTRLEATASET